MVERRTNALATAQLSGVRGRAVVTAKHHHLVVDSPLNLGGPNDALNPVDMLLGSLASHVAFVCERAAQEAGIPLSELTVKATGAFDPRGATEDGAQPALQSVDVQLYLNGPDLAQVQQLLRAVELRCLVYATLARAVPAQLIAVGDPDGLRPDAVRRTTEFPQPLR